MAKKLYKAPTLMTLTPDDDPNVSFGASVNTGGYDNIFSWDAELEDLIGLYSDEELAAMDTNEDYHISVDEFDAFTGS